MAWGLGMQAPGQQGIDWIDVGDAAVTGAVSSGVGDGIKYGAEKIKSRALDVVGSAVWREISQQGRNGFDGWTSGPGLNWTGITRLAVQRRLRRAKPRARWAEGRPEGPRSTSAWADYINSAYNPSSGWAIPGSGRSPTVGAFEYAYSAVANGAASMGYNWIRDQLERPSAPPKVTGPRSVDQSRGPLPAELLDEWDEMDRQFYKADLAAQTVAKVEQPDAISSADWAAEHQDRLTLTVPSDHNIVQALRTKQIYVVQKGDRSTEDIAEHMGHDRRDGSYLALANGYDPRYVKEGDVFHNTYVSPNDARLANAQIYPLERQAKLARNERRWQQELAAGRQKAALEAALRISEEEELRGVIGEPPSLETLANLAMMGMNNPAVQTALLNPDLGRKIPATKTMFYQGVPFTVASGLHEIGSQPEIDADWSANSMVVDMVDIQTPSEIANRTGQSDYLNIERYMKRFPSSSLEGYFLYRAGADRETLGAWDRYTNAFNIGSLIAQGTMIAMSFPALSNPIGFGLSYYAAKVAGPTVNYLTGSDFLGMLAGNLAGMAVAGIAAPKGNTVGGLLEAQRRARLDLTLARTLPEGHVWTSVAPGVEIGLPRPQLQLGSGGFAPGKAQLLLGRPTGVSEEYLGGLVSNDAGSYIATNQVTLRAVARAGIDSENLLSPSYRNFFSGQQDGVPGVTYIDRTSLHVFDANAYVKWLSDVYRANGSSLHPMTEAMVRARVSDPKAVLSQGLPGTHAEVRAANWIYNNLPPSFLNNELTVEYIQTHARTHARRALPSVPELHSHTPSMGECSYRKDRTLM